jgi:hypothetical protein
VDPRASWQEIQRQAFEFIQDMGSFDHDHAMVMGEYSMTIALMAELIVRGVQVYVACMENGYQDEKIGVKKFQPRRFVQFREVA